MELEFLYGDVDWRIHGGCFINQEPVQIMIGDNEHDCYGAVLFQPVGDEMLVTTALVAPTALDKDALDSAVKAMGCDADGKNPHSVLEAVLSYGAYATVNCEIIAINEENAEKAMSGARKIILGMPTLIFFYLDKQCNRIGATGWDSIQGESVPSRLRSNKENDE